MPHQPRSTAEVVGDHLELAQQGDVATDIARNFAADCMVMTSYGNFEGHDGIRRAAELLERQLGPARYVYTNRQYHGELGFLEWSAATDRAVIRDGADSYWVHDGLIRAMTAHYTVEPPDA